MHKIILVMFLAVVSSSAMAEWVEVGVNDDGATVYANPDTIRRAGKRTKMWSLVDYKTAQVIAGELYMSRTSLHEYDCKDEQHRILSASFYSKNMRRGNTVATESNRNSGKWAPNPPDTVAESLWKFSCEK